jgi:hypothetical protein
MLIARLWRHIASRTSEAREQRRTSHVTQTIVEIDGIISRLSDARHRCCASICTKSDKIVQPRKLRSQADHD